MKKLLFCLIVTMLLASACGQGGTNAENAEAGLTPEERWMLGTLEETVDLGEDRTEDGVGDEETADQLETETAETGTADIYTPEVAGDLSGVLSGEITLLAIDHYQAIMGRYASLFNAVNPHVQITIETYSHFDSLTDRMALNTRLMADPPDLFMFPHDMDINKLNLEALFYDLNHFIDGPQGLNRQDYFENILAVAERGTGLLFYIPAYVRFNMALLNRRLFEGIGVDVSALSYITVDDKIQFYFQMAEAFPDEEIKVDQFFNVFTMLLEIPLMDFETMKVFVNTPEMYWRVSQALEMPLHPNAPSFTPDAPSWLISSMGTQRYTEENNQMMYFGQSISTLLGQFMPFYLEVLPQMQWSAPVFWDMGDGFGMISEKSYAIPRGAANGDLAWEFLRFILEIEEDLNVQGDMVYFIGGAALPINRARFDNQVRPLLERGYQVARHMHRLDDALDALGIDHDAHQAETVQATFDFFKGAIDRFTFDRRYDLPTLITLAYPDMWLMISGQRDVGVTLENIHNRLLLYLHE